METKTVDVFRTDHHFGSWILQHLVRHGTTDRDHSHRDEILGRLGDPHDRPGRVSAIQNGFDFGVAVHCRRSPGFVDQSRDLSFGLSSDCHFVRCHFPLRFLLLLLHERIV